MKNKFLNKIKYNNIVLMLSLIVMIITISVFTFPASTLENSSGVTVLANSDLSIDTNRADTDELIEINLYDYGSNINYEHYYNNNLPGFEQSYGVVPESLVDYSLKNPNVYKFGDAITTDLDAGLPSRTTGINVSSLYIPLRKQIYEELINGYPALNTSKKESLEYLFSEGTYADKKNTKNLNNLFKYDEESGKYSYSSRENHAEYDEVNDKLVVYNQKLTPNYLMYPFGNFLPFNKIKTETTQTSLINSNRIIEMYNDAANKYASTRNEQYQRLMNSLYYYNFYMGGNYSAQDGINKALTAMESSKLLKLTNKNSFYSDLDNLYSIDFDKATNFFFGFEMKMNFMQPKDGLTGKNNDESMKFYFAGDDDVWVYIDGVLFLELSGIHAQVGGEIDFKEGVVRYYDFDKNTYAVGKNVIDTVSFETILRENSDKLENGTFKDYSMHSLNFYYMERGAGASVMATEFNMPLIKDNSVIISKELSSSNANTLGDPTYYFQLAKPNSTDTITDDNLFVGANYRYDVFDDYGNKIRSTQTDSNGIIKLKKDEHAVLSIKENSGNYYVRELLADGMYKNNSKVIVNGIEKTLNSNTPVITLDVNNTKTKYALIDSALADSSNSNVVFKYINDINTGILKIKKTLKEGTSDDSFKFNVTIDGVPLKVGTSYKVGTVKEEGVIYLKQNEVAEITNILAGASFEVKEDLTGIGGYSDSYMVNSETQEGSASGEITTTSEVEVIVTNAEKPGTSIKIPIEKITTNPDGFNHKYTFVLYDIDKKEEVVDPVTITVDENGEGTGFFEVKYSQKDHSTSSTTHKYKIYEKSESDDKYTLYDDAVYYVEVTVKNNSQVLSATSKITDDAGVDAEIVFNNKRLSSLTIKKIVDAEKINKNRNFKFNIKVEGITEGVYKTNDGTISFENGIATYSLHHNESVTIYGLPYNAKYTITETNKDGFTAMHKVDSSGYVEGDTVTSTLIKDSVVTFKNVLGYELPKTGSSGVLVVMLVGTIFVSISSVCLIKKKIGEI